MTKLKTLPVALVLFAFLTCGLPADAGAVTVPGGPTEASEMTITLSKGFLELLRKEDVKVSDLGPAEVRGADVELPGGEGMLEQSGGTGWVYLQGGLRFRHGAHRVTLRRLVVNTAKGWITATANGTNVVLAKLDGTRAVPTTFGVTVKLRSLQLGSKAAAVLNRGLGLRRAFSSRTAIGKGEVAADLQSVQLGSGTLSFALEEGFRGKLQALGVRVVPNESGAQTSEVPVTFTWSPSSLGSISRGLLHGGISAGEGGLSFIQGEFTTQVRLWHFGLGFEPNDADASWDVRLPDGQYRPMFSAPFGAIDVRGATRIDESAGTIGMPPTQATLAPAAANILNEAFAGGKSTQFVVGEPLGAFYFSGSLR
ncbi:MAG: hypothetical protein ACTHN3_05515 [Solirubrobacterales bacterium]